MRSSKFALCPCLDPGDPIHVPGTSVHYVGDTCSKFWPRNAGAQWQRDTSAYVVVTSPRGSVTRDVPTSAMFRARERSSEETVPIKGQVSGERVDPTAIPISGHDSAPVLAGLLGKRSGLDSDHCAPVQVTPRRIELLSAA